MDPEAIKPGFEFWLHFKIAVWALGKFLMLVSVSLLKGLAWLSNGLIILRKCLEHCLVLSAKYLFDVQSVQLLSCVNSLWPHGLRHARLPCPSPTPGITQTHVHWVSDAIQPSHPLSSPSPPAFYLSQHQGLFQWVSSSHQVAKVLEFQLQHQSFQWIFRTDFL